MASGDIIVRENGGSPGDIVVSDVVGGAVELGETVAFSESRVSKLATARQPTETVSLSEAAVAKAGRSYSLTETVSLSDAIDSHEVTIDPGDLAETVAYSEAQTSLRRAFFEAEETVTLTDAQAVAVARHTYLSESVTLTESAALQLAAKPGVGESVAFSELLQGGQHFVAELDETVTLSDGNSSLMDFNVQLLEDPGLAVAVAGETANAMQVNVFESWPMVEAVAGAAGAKGAVSESVAVSEGSNLASVYHDTPLETVSSDEAIRARRPYITTVGETVTGAEGVGYDFGAVVRLFETLGHSAYVVPSRKFMISLAEGASISESMAHRRRARAAVGESVAFSDGIVRGGAIHNALVETLALAEAQSTHRTATQLLEEEVILSEAVAGGRRMRAILAESLSLGEDIGGDVQLAQVSLRESLTLAEALQTRARLALAVAETVVLTEAEGALRARRARLAESLSLGEEIRVSRGVSLSVVESVSLSESPGTPARAGQVLLDEEIVLDEAQESLATMSSGLGEALGYSESGANHRGLVPVALAETLGLSNLLAGRLGHSNVHMFDWDLSEDSAAILHTFITNREGYLIFERVRGRQRARSALSETVGSPGEGIAGRKHAYLRLTESLSVGDSLQVGP